VLGWRRRAARQSGSSDEPDAPVQQDDVPPVAADPWQALVDRAPPAIRRHIETWQGRWPGRIFFRLLTAFTRVELFDRSMTIAAQFFTSIFPLVIAISSFVGGTQVAEALRVPEETMSVLEDALDQAPDDATFGVVGILFVLASATSLSRALTRAFAAVWELPRPAVSLTSVWRWVAAVLVLVMALAVARSLGRLLEGVPPPTLWGVAGALATDVAIATIVPWILLSGAVAPRRLLPGATLFALVMLFVRPASDTWLPEALLLSSVRYGSIGVAFTYLAWLYVVAFCLLSASVVGQVLATDSSPVGRWIRGEPSGR
jgi:membrane protein